MHRVADKKAAGGGGAIAREVELRERAQQQYANLLRAGADQTDAFDSAREEIAGLRASLDTMTELEGLAREQRDEARAEVARLSKSEMEL